MSVSELIKSLNSQQQTAVTMPFDNHCLVLAGAGCGKTTVLTRRIAYCALTQCDQNRILALTFTRKAAQEMAARLQCLPGIDPQKPLPIVTTFHAFGLRVLHEEVHGITNSRRLGYTKEPVLLEEQERLKLLAEISTTQQRRELSMTLMDLDNLLACEAVHKKKESRLSEDSRKVLQVIEGCFMRAKKERGFWEFSDMIEKVLELLQRFPEVQKYYAHRFDYILVDEFQDTNPLQIEMLKRFISDRNRVFAVGDDDQAIYGFRGADVGTILAFESHFPGSDIVKLEINYRSTPAILAAANTIFADKSSKFRKILRSGRYPDDNKNSGHKPVKHLCEDTTAMIEWIKETGERIEKKDGIPFCEMVLLFRVNESLDHVQKDMQEMLGDQSALPRFMTIHGSKGLEFPVVFLCDMEEGIFPNYRISKTHRIKSWADLFKSIARRSKRKNPEFDYEEERRLFYVGVTRAEKYLYLLGVRKKYVRGRIIPLRESRFLKFI